MASQTRPEPMNASPHHSKVRVTLTLPDPIFVAGQHVAGKMEMECRADQGLGINVMMVELVAIQELTSRDHSATSTFLHARRIFQGPGLPPSNAVQPHPIPGDPPLPPHYHQARRGISTFLFRFPIPSSSPSSLNFGAGLARVRYEVRASVGVIWKGERRLVTDKKEVDIVESFEENFERVEPEGVIVGENGKIWVQGRVVGGVVVAGESACIELEVKNHSQKKNTGLTITLTRALHLPSLPPGSQKPPLQISDTLTTVAFRGPEYIIPPGAEGVASLVFDIPKNARGVKGGTREGDEAEARMTEPLFEVRCIVGVKLGMGIGSKDIILDLPVTVVHPYAIPELPIPGPYQSPTLYPYAPTPDPLTIPYAPVPPAPYLNRTPSPYTYPALPLSPPIHNYADQGHVWLPPPTTPTPHPYQYLSPPIDGQQYYFPPPLTVPTYASPPRPSSAGPSTASHAYPSGLPIPITHNQVLPLDTGTQEPADAEEGKGERASRITHHLRLSSRHRSVSPQSHRFPLPASNPMPVPPPKTTVRNLPPAPIITTNLSISPSNSQGVVHSPRPFLSPKQSYTQSLPKSERVEELERMAAEVEAQTKDLSGDIPKPTPASPESPNLNKTLPGPPVPTGKGQLLSPPAAVRTRVDTYFATASDPEPLPSDKTPPTPTLTAITPARHSRSDNLDGLGQAESGLDALERRLLAEVGTRKMDKDEKRPDVRTVLPITIPTSNPVHEPLNDSAISSLTLADHDSDERTHRAGKSSLSGDDREGHGHERSKEGRVRVESGRAERDGERRRKKDRGKDGETHRMRKSAKGRVAAWLGGIDPEIPPDVLPLSNPGPDLELPSVQDPGKAPMEETPEEKDISSAPDPRSSGFVPIGTLKRDTFQRKPAAKETPIAIKAADEPKKVADVWSALPDAPQELSPPVVPSPARTPRPAETNRKAFPPSSPPHEALSVNGNGKLPSQALKVPTLSKPDIPPPKKALKPPSRLPAFPPSRVDSEVKYDIRSARGGRGGKVTAVASIWASGAVNDPKPKDASKKATDFLPTKPLRSNTKSSPPKSGTATPTGPKFVDLAGRRARPVIKSSSVPAVISSSHATPTLSSTASLARPSPTPNKARPPVKVPPTISETYSEVGRTQQVNAKALPALKSPVSGDLAFGQARLRDLIKKYQGQAT